MARVLVVFSFVLVLALCTAAHADSVLDKQYPYLEEDPLYIQLNGDGIYTVAQEKQAASKREAMKRAWEKGGIKRIAQDVDRALDMAFTIGILNLRHKGFHNDAAWMAKEWKAFKGTLPRIVEGGSRLVGDWTPLSTFLAVAYLVLEQKLGYSFCHASHLEAIWNFNFEIWLVLMNPCSKGEQEFYYHFVGDDPALTATPRRGLLPETSYFLTQIGCSIATFAGAGIFWLCGPLSSLVCLGVEKVVAPYLSPKLYNALCD